MERSFTKPVTLKIQPKDEPLRLFFDALLAQDNSDNMASAIVGFIEPYVFKMENYKRVAETYSRTIVSQPGNGFEAMIARWSEKTVTAIHGHPDYAFYYCLAGRIGVEHFMMEKSGLGRISSKIMRPGEYYSIQGKPGTFDNAIHRITSLEESLSLHVYSDDPSKGRVFKADRIPSSFVTVQQHLTCPRSLRPAYRCIADRSAYRHVRHC